MKPKFWTWLAIILMFAMILYACAEGKTGATFAITNISGTVTSDGSALQGVTITLSPSSATTTTDASGNYTFEGVITGAYTVTPSMKGYTFNPVNIAVTINGASSTGNNFAVTYYIISGTVTGPSVSGILVTLSGASSATTTTDASGNYTFKVHATGAYTVTPSMTGYVFSPVSIAVTISSANSIANNFVTQLGGAIQSNPLKLVTAVSTMAGLAGTSGSANGTGTAALFNFPRGITTDGTSLYVVDTGNDTIRKIVISTGVVTTLAGTAGSSGSANGTGTAALFNSPRGITTDGTNLYVADTGNDTIRKIAKNNICYYFVSGTLCVYTGVTVTTLAGTVGSSGSADGTGAAALFNSPQGITMDGTNLYITDTVNNTIRQIVISTGAVTTLAGTAGSSGSTDGAGSAALFNSPQGITTDGTNLYVADTINNTIRQIVISTGAVTTLAGTAGSSGSADGIGSAARFSSPQGITTDGTNLYVADASNNTIRKIVISTGAVTTLAGAAGSSGSIDGTGAAALFNSPQGITTDGTNLYVADTDNNTIRKIQ
ncbi:MAG: carboxypeptidase regulatory-like domain-containing protein [Syntrophales bacterium]